MPDPAPDTATEEKKGVGGTTLFDDIVSAGEKIARKRVKSGLEQGLKQADKPIKLGFEAMIEDLEKKIQRKNDDGTIETLVSSPELRLELEYQIAVIKTMQPIYEKNFEDFAYQAGREIVEDLSHFKLKNRRAETAGNLPEVTPDWKFNVTPPDYKIKIRPDWESMVKSEFFGDIKKFKLDFNAAHYAKFKDDLGWLKYMKHFGVEGKVGCNFQIESFNAAAAATAGVDVGGGNDNYSVGLAVNGFWQKWTFSATVNYTHDFRDGEDTAFNAAIMFSLNPSGEPFMPVEP